VVDALLVRASRQGLGDATPFLRELLVLSDKNLVLFFGECINWGVVGEYGQGDDGLDQLGGVPELGSWQQFARALLGE